MKNQLLYTVRGLRKNSIFHSISLVGLSIAFGTCLLILFYVNFEYSHDRFHVDKQNIFRVVHQAENPEGEMERNVLHNYRLAERIKKDVPQIRYASGFRFGWGAIIKYKEHTFTDRLGIVEPDFLRIFSFPLLVGSVESVFQSPAAVVITKKFADKILDEKYPDYEDLIGRPIEFLNKPGTFFTISGVLEDIPKTSSLKFELLIGFDHQSGFGQSNNDFGNSSMYVELFPEADFHAAEQTVTTVLKSFYEKTIAQFQTLGYFSKSEDSYKPLLQNIIEIYFDGESSEYEASSSRNYSLVLSIIGIIILITACINYLLLSYGLTIKKVHQLGILKVFGATRWQIMKQFWVEALALTSFSILLGLFLSYLFFPLFREIAQRDFEILLINKWIVVVFMISACFLVSALVAFPLVLSFQNVNPLSLLKKQIANKKKAWISNSFVLFQYTGVCTYHILLISLYSIGSCMTPCSINL